MANHSMTLAGIGTPTHFSRVERWECDFNDHWNTRFYARSFQMAAETLAAAPDGTSPGAPVTTQRHMRFHNELRISAPVEVRSARIADGALAGSILHLLFSGPMLAGAAVDGPMPLADLPSVPMSEILPALPRGLPADAVARLDWSAQEQMPLGPVRPLEVDHTGYLTFDSIIRLGAITSHRHMNAIGFTCAYTEGSRINRMAVEFRATLGPPVRAGTVVRASSCMIDTGRRSFRTASRIVTEDGRLIALLEQCLVAVNLDSRKAVDLPEFVRAAAGIHLNYERQACP
jgi:acyl-CoA thioester hydrolase